MDNFDLRKYLAENKTPQTYIDAEGDEYPDVSGIDGHIDMTDMPDFETPIMYDDDGEPIEEMTDMPAFQYERGIVQKVIRQAIEDMSSNTALGTREYIDEIINSLEELKISDF